MATVLVVDDEPEIRASLRGVLGDEGHRVLEADNGREALALIRAERPDLLLLDVWMPELDGIELLQILQNEHGRPQVIMISGHGNIETAVKATKLGAFDFIEKPFSIDALLTLVNRALRHASALGGVVTHDVADGKNGQAAAAPPHHSGMIVEKTIAKSVVASGLGLHSGIKSGIILHPLPAGSGVVFASVSSADSVPAHLDYVSSTGYATTLHRDTMSVQTIEHLLATLHAYGVTNALIKVQNEVPVMDGSARDFCELIEGAGIEEQGRELAPVVVKERIVHGEDVPGKPCIAIEPGDGFTIRYHLRYPAPVGEQEYEFRLDGFESFKREVAPARTFGFVKDMKAMAAVGLANGGRLDNCILIDDEKVINTTLRFPEEFARHKILDIMGDLYLLGRPLRGRVTARMTGHGDNIALLRKIREAAA